MSLTIGWFFITFRFNYRIFEFIFVLRWRHSNSAFSSRKFKDLFFLFKNWLRNFVIDPNILTFDCCKNIAQRNEENFEIKLLDLFLETLKWGGSPCHSVIGPESEPSPVPYLCRRQSLTLRLHYSGHLDNSPGSLANARMKKFDLQCFCTAGRSNYVSYTNIIGIL